MAGTLRTSKSRCAYERYKSRRSDCQSVGEEGQGVNNDYMPDDMVHVDHLIQGLLEESAVVRALSAQTLGLTLPKS